MTSIRFNLRTLLCSAFLLSACSVDVDRTEEEDASIDGDDDDFADDDETDHGEDHGGDDWEDEPHATAGKKRDAGSGKKKHPDAGTPHGDAGHATPDGGTHGASPGAVHANDMDSGMHLPRGPRVAPAVNPTPGLGANSKPDVGHEDEPHAGGDAEPTTSGLAPGGALPGTSGNPRDTTSAPDQTPLTEDPALGSGSDEARTNGDNPQQNAPPGPASSSGTPEPQGTPDPGAHDAHGGDAREDPPPGRLSPGASPMGPPASDSCGALVGADSGFQLVQVMGCTSECHAASASGAAPRLDTADRVFALRSRIYTRVLGDDARGPMPPSYVDERPAQAQIEAIAAWFKCNP